MKKLAYSILVVAAITVITAQRTPSSAADTVAPPVAKKLHTENHINGGNLADDYHWLREKLNPEVARYLEAENSYTDSVMRRTETLQKRLYDEMLSHVKETDVNVPYKEGDYFYYSRWEAGKQYLILGRKPGSVGAAEQIILDVNELAKGEKFMSLGTFEVSDDGNRLAYSTDNTGFRQYRMHVRDLRTGKDLPDTAEKTGSLVWASRQPNALLHDRRSRQAAIPSLPAHAGERRRKR